LNGFPRPTIECYMKKIYPIILAAAVAVIALFTSSCSSQGQEPSYQGKPLSRWADDMTLDHSKAVRDQAQEAIRQIGTNAIPFLLEELRALAEINLTNYNTPEWQDRRYRIHTAFAALGPIAEPAIPSLTDLMNGSSSATACAAYALAEIGPKGVIPLVKTLTNGSLEIRIGIAQIISEAGTNAEIAVPALIQCTTYQSPEQEKAAALRVFSTSALGVVGINSPASVVPALIRCLQDEDYRIRYEAARALGKFGKPAQSAVPALQQIAKDDPNLKFRAYATNVLQIIITNSP
jgi:HEAT repeat protein